MSFKPLKSFYNELITNEHRTGDIWSNLPTHGLLKVPHLPGIIITPVCDLANEKVETISYLPIVSIRKFLTSTVFLSEIKGTLIGLSAQLKPKEIKTNIADDWPPSIGSIDKMINIIQKPKGNNEKEKYDRFMLLIDHLRKILSIKSEIADMKKLATAIGYKYFNKIIKNIITNSYRSDIYFLPSDGLDPSWSVIKEHSLILFRYPLTAPIYIFDLAQNSDINSWDAEVDLISHNMPYIKAFNELRPIKTLRMSESFLHDMLNRFVMLYARLGSPDLTNNTINKIAKDLEV